MSALLLLWLKGREMTRHPREVEQDLPFNRRNVLIAIAAVALACWISSLFPLGWAA